MVILGKIAKDGDDSPVYTERMLTLVIDCVCIYFLIFEKKKKKLLPF